jgi:hypothetical protein
MCNLALTGPNYKFSNKVVGISCNFLVHENISVEDEVFLVENYPKEIPLEFLSKINIKAHVGSRLYTYSKFEKPIVKENFGENVFYDNNQFDNYPIQNYDWTDKPAYKESELAKIKKQNKLAIKNKDRIIDDLVKKVENLEKARWFW